MKLLSFFIALTLLASCNGQESVNKLDIITQDGRVLSYSVEVAITVEAQARGLMDRTSMPENEGMLFPFEDYKNRTFWMKDTLIPLDMIFINREGKIASIHHNAQPLTKALIHSNGPAAAVLEINGGQALANNISVGDKVSNVILERSLAAQ